ncbi:BA75_05209T0 [Komagataella pastoris]|uniref:BA75_05209T0 n=1 Tax=Komagataella pastoris TaxID=4922 RepID=A0A1B2JJ78_PICPA|nr:BA75_05209T0 [Komagataella pastoris]
MLSIISNIFILLFFIQASLQAPIPVVTKYVTEGIAVVTETNVRVVTQTIPIVQVLISDGATYTHTLTTVSTAEENGNFQPITTTSIVNKEVVVPTSAAETTQQPQPTQADTTQNNADTAVAATPSPAATTSSNNENGGVFTAYSTTRSVVTSVVVVGPDGSPIENAEPTANPATTAPTTSTTAARTTSSTSTTPTATSTPGGNHPRSIVYSPYSDSSQCKDSSTIETDLEFIASKGISAVRIYGNDCNYLTVVLPKCASLGLKVNQGFWIGPSGVDSIDEPVQEFIQAVNGNNGFNWDLFELITVGNEAISAGYVSASSLISKIKEVSSILSSAGYSGPITTAEPPNVYEDYGDLCSTDVMSIVGVNAHSYFNTLFAASDSGSFVKSQIEVVQKACSRSDITIIETGYPSRGATNGKNVPTKENQKTAIFSIFDVVGTDVTILSTYDDLWKDPGPYGIEQYFGAIDLFS